MINPTGSTGAKGETGMSAPLETRLPSPGGLYTRLFSASGAEWFISA